MDLAVHNIVKVKSWMQVFGPVETFYTLTITATDNKGNDITFKMFSAVPLVIEKE